VTHQTTRAELLRTVSRISAPDLISRDHLDTAMSWIRSGAPLWRTEKPATPPVHLVSYFLPADAHTGRFLLVHHRKAGLLLPAGGHVEPFENPWQTVVREASEELRLTPDSGPQEPIFITVTQTRGPGVHTDVSLWFLLDVTESDIDWYDEAEFSGITWLSAAQILELPADRLDPHMHRFLRSIG
jgi:8-oxo-dGTP pyrophosphatase MutT (NUDIX family)